MGRCEERLATGEAFSEPAKDEQTTSTKRAKATDEQKRANDERGAGQWRLAGEGDAFVAAGLDGHGEEFGEGDAGEDEQSAGSAAAAEAFAVEEEGSEPREDRLEGEDERGVRGGKILLCPRLDGEGGGGGEDGCDEEGDEDAGGGVKQGRAHPWMLEQGQADGHEGGAEADLEDGELFEGNARGKTGESQDVEGESEGAGQGEEVAETDGAEVEGGAGRGGEEDEAGKGDECSEPGVPFGDVGAADSKCGDGGKHGDEDDNHAGDEGGFGGGGEAEAGGLELIAHGEAGADDGAGEEGAAVHATEVAAVEEGQAKEGEGHAEEVEEERGRRR
jgi:hypothetical protein